MLEEDPRHEEEEPLTKEQEDLDAQAAMQAELTLVDRLERVAAAIQSRRDIWVSSCAVPTTPFCNAWIQELHFVALSLGALRREVEKVRDEMRAEYDGPGGESDFYDHMIKALPDWLNRLDKALGHE